jgi:hypothetical protein
MFFLLVIVAMGRAGCGPRLVTPTPPPSAPSLSIGFGLKHLLFSWTASNGVTSYRLFQRPDGVAPFTQIGSDLSASNTNTNIDDIAVHWRNWGAVQYALDACNSAGCTQQSTGSSVASQIMVMPVTAILPLD